MYYYVSRRQGDNQNDGLSMESALKTIAHAQKIAKVGDLFQLVEKKELMTCLGEGEFNREPLTETEGTSSGAQTQTIEVSESPVEVKEEENDASNDVEAEADEIEPVEPNPVIEDDEPEAEAQAKTEEPEMGSLGIIHSSFMEEGSDYSLTTPNGEVSCKVITCSQIAGTKKFKLHLNVPMEFLNWLNENEKTITEQEAIKDATKKKPIEHKENPVTRDSYSVNQHRVGQVMSYSDRPASFGDNAGKA